MIKLDGQRYQRYVVIMVSAHTAIDGSAAQRCVIHKLKIWYVGTVFEANQCIVSYNLCISVEPYKVSVSTVTVSYG